MAGDPADDDRRLPLGTAAGLLLYFPIRYAVAAYQRKRRARLAAIAQTRAELTALKPGECMKQTTTSRGICALALTSITWRPSGTPAAAGIPTRFVPPIWRRKPVPTASPRICAKTGGTSAMAISRH